MRRFDAKVATTARGSCPASKSAGWLHGRVCQRHAVGPRGAEAPPGLSPSGPKGATAGDPRILHLCESNIANAPFPKTPRASDCEVKMRRRRKGVEICMESWNRISERNCLPFPKLDGTRSEQFLCLGCTRIMHVSTYESQDVHIFINLITGIRFVRSVPVRHTNLVLLLRWRGYGAIVSLLLTRI